MSASYAPSEKLSKRAKMRQYIISSHTQVSLESNFPFSTARANSFDRSTVNKKNTGFHLYLQRADVNPAAVVALIQT
jgi:hypothetical protein